MNTTILSVALFAVAGSLIAPSVSTQTPEAPKLEFPAASPAASFEQRVGLTDVSVKYSRPSAKGRKIFGGLVPFDSVWRTGANSATSISFSTDVKFGGADVPEGTYSLHTIPGTSEWTVILNTVTQQWGSYAYDEKSDIARVTVKAKALHDSVESFTIAASNLGIANATLDLAWEKTLIQIPIETDVVKLLVPKIESAMAAEGKKPYLQSAMFYYENGLDLKKALAWADAAVAEQPDAPWIIYRKGLILAKLNDKAGALAAATRALELATKAGGSLGEEYTRLSKELIERCK